MSILLLTIFTDTKMYMKVKVMFFTLYFTYCMDCNFQNYGKCGEMGCTSFFLNYNFCTFFKHAEYESHFISVKHFAPSENRWFLLLIQKTFSPITD